MCGCQASSPLAVGVRPVNTFAPFRITVCGIEELSGHCDAKVSHVLSILDPEWPVPEVFGTFGEHAKLELRFHDIIDERNADMIAPREEDVAELLTFGRGLLDEPRADAHLLVHCHAGVSRSTASMALILAQTLPDVPASRNLRGSAAHPPAGVAELAHARAGRCTTEASRRAGCRGGWRLPDAARWAAVSGRADAV